MAMMAVHLLGLWALRASAVEITVYNRNLALVQERRSFDLRAGTNRVEVDGLPDQTDPSSVLLKCEGPGPVALLEQDFDRELTPESLLSRHVGREIEMERGALEAGEKSEVVKGILLSQKDGRVVALRVGDKIHLNPPGAPILPELETGRGPGPALFWSLEARKGGSYQCAFSYLAGGFSWSADYSIVLAPGEAAADLGVWATIANDSDAAFKGVRLNLLAGEPHRAVRESPAPFLMEVVRAAPAMASNNWAKARSLSESVFSEYHLYTLKDRATELPDHEAKQLELARAVGIAVRKTYVYRGAQTEIGDFSEYTRSDPGFGLASRAAVEAFVEFENAEPNHLGVPLPAGRARIYEADATGSLKFIGEDSVAHTPKGEKVKAALGAAFDLRGERRRTAFESDVHKRSVRESFEIKLKNHGGSPASVEVVEPLYRWSGWKIEEASTAWRKKDAQTIAFDVPVPSGGDATLTYTVRYSW